MPGQGRVLVTDSRLRPALYVIRNLGARGVHVATAERLLPKSEDLGGRSRYVRERVVVPSNNDDPEGFAEAVLRAAGDFDVVLPIGMHAIEAIGRRGDAFRARAGLALAPWETIELADDTRRLLELATQLGVPQPPRWRLRDYPDIDSLVEAVAYPAYVKAGIDAGLPPAERYRRVTDADSCRAAVRLIGRVTDDPIIQTEIVGDGIGVEFLYDFEHRPIAWFCHRRLREYPLTGGPSTYCESIEHPEAVGMARRLLDHLKWVGLAMVEFKLDRTSGTPVLMEINPRPWGSMALPVAAGTEFPWLWYQLARDGRVPAAPPPRPGVRLRFAASDVRAVAAKWPQATWGERAGMVASLLDPRVHEGVLSWRDPMPGLGLLARALA